MPKYRYLTEDEFAQFEKEFVEYLVVNGITAEDWEKLKSEDPNKASSIHDLFADVVFEKIMRNVSFLLYRSAGNIQAIQCLQDKMVLVAVTATRAEVNLETIELKNLTTKDVEFVRGEKEYSDGRELELFQMTEKGYQITDGEIFKQLMLASVSN